MGMDYSAIASKLKAMHANAIGVGEIERLIQMNSVREICAYLKDSEAYKEVLSGTDAALAHRGEIEMHLNEILMQEYERLYSFMDRDKRTMLRFWFTRQEINLLTAGLRHIFTHERISNDVLRLGNTHFFETHSGIDVQALLMSKSLSDVTEACADTAYYELLKRAEEASSDYFSITMMLDAYYYRSLWRAKDKLLDKSEIGIFAELVGSMADMLNIMWIYRGKKYFGFNAELIYTYLLPVQYRLTKQQIAQLVNAASTEQVISAIADSSYAKLVEFRDGDYFIEEIYHKIVREKARRIFRDHPKSMAAVFAYLILKEHEIHAITMIIEGVRYNYSPEIIREHVEVAGRDTKWQSQK